ncbi:MAG: NnrS family protein [Myxococcales bacterium]|nr:NnrS family protein [Myxococcales bacterium]
MKPQLRIMGQDTGGPPPTGHVFWQTGFRPFFLAAGVHGVLFVPAWLLLLGGQLPLRPALGLLPWHAHEMLFGFTLAVIAAFLLTAGMVWTGRVTARGPALMGLVALWVASRVLNLTPYLLGAAVVSVALPVLLAVTIARPVIAAKSTRNLPFIPLLLVMAAAEAALYAEAAGLLTSARGPAEWVALDVAATMIVIVGGRIVPMFTKNATGAEIRGANLLDQAAPWSLVALMAAHAATLPAAITAALALAAGAINLLRMRGWGTRSSLAQPFVAVLHAGYAGLALGLLVEGALSFTPQANLHLGRHVMAIGGVAMLCLGMMTRVTLGHTGRPLHPPKGSAALYGLLLVAMFTRAAALLVPDLATPLLWVTGSAFILSFAGYLALYARFLVAPRADGKPG